MIVAQLEQRPLAKMQEALEAENGVGPKTPDAGYTDDSKPSGNGNADTNGETKPKHHHKALLKDDDRELTRVQVVRIRKKAFASIQGLCIL